MHDPLSVAHEIKWPFPRKEQFSLSKEGCKYRKTIITIWHKDPETDGTDDSCGWFLRPRHVNQDKLEEIKKEFEFNFKHNYWFDKEGKQIFSTGGTLIQMYSAAAWIHFDRNRKKHRKFMRKYLFDILNFAENPVDCGGDAVTNKWNEENFESRVGGLASMVYTDICRKLRPWYKHPKWHIHHWRIQFHPWQQLVRRYWTKCSICGKRGFKVSAISDWGGKNIWHSTCDGSVNKVDDNLRETV